MEAYQVARPCQEAPYLEVGTACRQVESRQDLLVAGIQEACLVEELAYLSRLSDFMSFAREPRNNTYQVESWAFQGVVGILVAGLEGAAACLYKVSIQYPRSIYPYAYTHQQGIQAAYHPEA